MSHSTKDISNYLRGIFHGLRATEYAASYDLSGLIRRGHFLQILRRFFPFQRTVFALKLASKARRLLAGVNAHCEQR